MAEQTGIPSWLHIGSLPIASAGEENHRNLLRIVDLARRAKIIGDAAIVAVEVRVGNGEWSPMSPVQGVTALWQASLAAPGAVVRVRAHDTRRRTDDDSVEPSGRDWPALRRHADGSDADRVVAWPEKGIFDAQLGPNRNGRKW